MNEISEEVVQQRVLATEAKLRLDEAKLKMLKSKTCFLVRQRHTLGVRPLS